MALTPLSMMFNAQLTNGSVTYVNGVISVFDHNAVPMSNWLITNALPVRWQTSDLDANSSSVLINTMELRYQEMIPLGVKL